MRTAEPDVVEVHLASHPKLLGLVRALVGEAARLAGFSDEEREPIVLAATEGVTNVIRHGYRGDTTRRIDLRLHAPPGSLQLDIEDDAPFVDPTDIRSRPLDEVRPGGLGVHLMRSTMDAVEYRRNDRGGTTLTLRKRVGNPPLVEPPPAEERR